jgi:hypothetical protein
MAVHSLTKPAVLLFVVIGIGQNTWAQALNDRDYITDMRTVCRLGFGITDREQAERRFANTQRMEESGKAWIGEFMLMEVHAYYRSVYRFDSLGSLGIKSARKLDSLTALYNQRYKEWIMGEWKWLACEFSWPDIPSMRNSSNSLVFKERKVSFIRNDSIIWEHDYLLRPYRQGPWMFTTVLEIPAIRASWNFDFDYWAKTDKAPRMLYISGLHSDENNIPGFYQKVEHW